jgi:hypothetical protein
MQRAYTIDLGPMTTIQKHCGENSNYVPSKYEDLLENLFIFLYSMYHIYAAINSPRDFLDIVAFYGVGGTPSHLADAYVLSSD